MSVAADKAFDKIQHPVIIKNIQLRIKGNYLNIIKVINEKKKLIPHHTQ